ncbi:MAG: twin-arginine translocation signal domain-containing protein, partial [Armatimonadota bacterium]
MRRFLTRRDFIAQTTLATAGLMTSTHAYAQGGRERPNIILAMTD